MLIFHVNLMTLNAFFVDVKEVNASVICSIFMLIAKMWIYAYV